MAATAAHLTDHVIPPVPVRQWVLSVPKRLRYFLHRDPKAAGAVLHILLRALQRTLREMLGWDHAGGFSLDVSLRIAAHARPLVCPECGEFMRLIAFLTDPLSIRDVLDQTRTG